MIIVGVFFAALLLAIVIKASYLQIFCYSGLTRKAANEYVRESKTHGKRGTIYDTNYKEMAVSIDVRSIAAYPPRVEDAENVSKALAEELNLDGKSLNQKLSSKRSFVWIKRKVTPGETKAVKSLGISGVDFIPEHRRFYPNRMLASQVIGFTGMDGRGLEGIEFYYDSYLEGDADSFTFLRDALGRRFSGIGPKARSDRERPIIPAIDNSLPLPRNTQGNNLVLTIDRTIQFIAESALENVTSNFSARSGMALVMDPKTGAMLALAHAPLFNPNSFGKFDQELWRNKAITDPFEPGSTMKIFTAASAIDSGICTPETIFFCEKGEYSVGEDVVHDSRPHAWLTLAKIIKYSSNIGSVKVSEAIGAERLYKTLCDFGFGGKTGIDCPGETAGSLSHYQRWSQIDVGAISFGQGLSVSAVQLVRAVSAIANKGTLMKPYIVQAITDKNHVPIRTFRPLKIRQAISAENADAIKKMMRSVVEKGGTGNKASLSGYAVCGKTGTAQKINENGAYAVGKYIASFVGFAPEQDPKVAILVVVDEPMGNHYGGVVAAPVFKKIAHETLNYMNIPPQGGKDRLTASKEREVNG